MPRSHPLQFASVRKITRFPCCKAQPLTECASILNDHLTELWMLHSFASESGLCFLPVWIYLVFILALIYIISLANLRTCYSNLYAQAGLSTSTKRNISNSLRLSHYMAVMSQMHLLIRSLQRSALTDRLPDRVNPFSILHISAAAFKAM